MEPARAKSAAAARSVKAAADESRKGRKGGSDNDKGRMIHVRLEAELHRKLRLVVAAEDTTLQKWIARTLEEAAGKAWAKVEKGTRR